jgi:hypothetical protein
VTIDKVSLTADQAIGGNGGSFHTDYDGGVYTYATGGAGMGMSGTFGTLVLSGGTANNGFGGNGGDAGLNGLPSEAVKGGDDANASRRRRR